MNNDINNETNDELNGGENSESDTEAAEETIESDTAENTEEDDDFASADGVVQTDDDDNSSPIDLPLPTQEEMNSIHDIELPEISNLSRPRRSREANKKALKISLIVLGILAAIFAATYIVCIISLPTNTIAHGVQIEHIDVGGLSRQDAIDKIKKTYMLENTTITLSANGQTFSIKGDEIGLTALPEETAKKAFEYGKSGNKLKDGLTAMGLIFHKHNIMPVANVDEEKLKEKINDFGNQVYGPFEKAHVDIGDGKALVYPGKTGYDGNFEKALEEIKEALDKDNYSNISVSLSTQTPTMLTLEEFDAAVYANPVDAHFKVENNQVSVEEASDGRYINKDEAAPLLALLSDGGSPVEIPFYVSKANVTSEELNSKLFANTMASYSTSYASSTASRASNVARAASLINGKVLAPGETFSFNDTVGRRTVANGFSTATEYVDGKSVEGIGGGTCQVSSTLYNAVLYSDLEIVTRTNHMFTVSYVPNGQDATVADGGPDFKFKNNTNYPIKISARAGGGTITVSIIGTNWDPAREVKINNSTSYGNNGDTRVSSTRTVYANGAVLRSESLPSSTYKKHVEEKPAAAAQSEPAVAASTTSEHEEESTSSSSHSESGGSSESEESTSSEDNSESED